MKERVSHNFGLKVLSVALAALLWLVVINSQDPVENVTFEDIPVTIINEDALTAKDKIPEVVEGDSVCGRSKTVYLRQADQGGYCGGSGF